jgi:hypothetical protein
MTTPMVRRAGAFRRMSVASEKTSTLLSRYQLLRRTPSFQFRRYSFNPRRCSEFVGARFLESINADREPNEKVGPVEERTPPRDVSEIVFFANKEVKEN